MVNTAESLLFTREFLIYLTSLIQGKVMTVFERAMAVPVQDLICCQPVTRQFAVCHFFTCHMPI